jgi:ATP-dependent Clp protease ATP-binding subunit ClpA
MIAECAVTFHIKGRVRLLKRVLQRQVMDPLAQKLIQGDIRDGDHVVVNGDFSFGVGKRPICKKL